MKFIEEYFECYECEKYFKDVYVKHHLSYGNNIRKYYCKKCWKKEGVNND